MGDNVIINDVKIKKGLTDEIHIGQNGTNAEINPSLPLKIQNTTELAFQYGQSQYVASGFVKVTQIAHTFAVKDVLRGDPGTGLYVRALADTADNAEVVGVVTVVVDANTFIMCIGGYISTFSGLTAGDVYFLSDGVPGLMTTTEPTTHGHISKPLFICKSTTEGFFVNFRGIEVPGASTTFPADHVTYDNSVSGLVATNVQDAIDEHVTDTANPHATSDENLVVTNVTTNNATAAQHGFLPKLSNVATQYLDGQGNWSTPAGTTPGYGTSSFVATTSKNVVHGLGAYPMVQVIDNTSAVLIPKTITHNTVNDFTVTFDANTTGTILYNLGAPQPQAVRTVNNDYTMTTADRIVQCTAAGKTISLLTAVGNTGFEFKIDNSSAADITVDCVVGGQTINGEATQTVPSDSCLAVYSDGTNWRIC